MILSPLAQPRERLKPGIAFAGRHLLQVAVVLLGAQLSLGEVASVGASSLPVMVGTLAVGLTLAYLLGRWMGVDGDLRTLIGVGTAICGASAIAAVSPTIRARNASVAYAMSTIFIFNAAAVLIFPAVGHVLHLSQHAFGLFAGTAVNDTSSVVAASTSYGVEAANYAIVVKLCRTLMIIPIVVTLAAMVHRRDRRPESADAVVPTGASRTNALLRVARLVPWFLVGFLLTAGLNSAGTLSPSSQTVLRSVAVFLTTVALAAIGLSTDGSALRRAGIRPVFLGLALWVAIATTSLALQALLP